MRRSFPDAFIVLLCDDRFADALATNTHLDEIWGIPFAEIKKQPHFKRAWLKTKVLIQTALRVRRAKFTRVLVTDVSNKACIWAIFSGAKIRAGLAGQLWSPFLSHTLVDREGSMDYLAYYLKQAALIGAHSLARKTYFPLSAPVIPKANLIAIHPGASSAQKRWPAKKWAELITQIAVSNSRARFVLLFGPGEQNLGEEILNAIGRSDLRARVSTHGVLSLSQTAAIMASASVVFCLDSASRHLAAALGVPTISLMTRWILPLWGLYDAADCHRVVLSDAPRDSYDVSQISVSEVLSVYHSRSASTRRARRLKPVRR